MKKKHLLIMTMVILFMVTPVAHAKIVMLQADFWTMTEINSAYSWWTSFRVYDERGAHVYPEFIQEVTVLGPNNITYNLIPHEIWDEFGKKRPQAWVGSTS